MNKKEKRVGEILNQWYRYAGGLRREGIEKSWGEGRGRGKGGKRRETERKRKRDY